MSAIKREAITKICIAAIMVAMIALCIANPNEDLKSDCVTSGQVVIIEDESTPLAPTVSNTSTKTTVKKKAKVKKLKKKAKKSKTTTKRQTKRSASTKKSGDKTIKTDKTVVTTTKTITKKKSKQQRIQTTIKTTIRTTTIAPTAAGNSGTSGTANAVNSGEVDVRSLAANADPDVLNAFESGGFKVVVNPKVSYSGVFRSASKTIELKTANSVVYHELGHFVSYRTGRADSTSEFRDIYNAEKGDYTYSNKAYVTQSTGEYFAESFKNYTENPSKLKSERPRTYDYVKSKVDQF